MVSIGSFDIATLIYVVVSMRIWIASKFDDFRARPSIRLDLSDIEPTQIKRIKALANFSILLLVCFWPAFIVFYPRLFLSAFVFGNKLALNRLNYLCCFNVGFTMALFRKIFNKFD